MLDLQTLKDQNGQGTYPAPITLMIGSPGVGKTYLASHIPETLGDTLLVDCDQGAMCYKGPKVLATNIDSFYAIIKAISEQKAVFQNIIFDDVQKIDYYITKSILESNRTYTNAIPKALDDPACANFSFGKGHSLLYTKWAAFLEKIKDIRNNKKISFFFLGHARIEKRDLALSNHETYDEQEVDLPKQITQLIKKEMDNIFVLSNSSVKPKAEDEKRTRSQIRYKGALQLKREIIVDTVPRYVAKTRLPLQYGIYNIGTLHNIHKFWKEFGTTWGLLQTQIKEEEK